MDLKDKVVVITGSSKGLGRELAAELVEEGCKIVISSRNEKELSQAAEEIGVFAVAADVTKENEIKVLAEKTVEKFGQIDIWINNAGIWQLPGPIEKTDFKEAHEIMEINLFGTIYGSKVALLQMRKQNNGMIINILSKSSLIGRKEEAIYCASKHAGDGFTKSLKCEVEGENIKVIAIYPGGMKTNFFENAKPGSYDDFMDPVDVAKKIIDNLKQESPEEELIIKRPTK